MKDEQSLLINRDLSWLEFNRRVLEEAKDPSVPLLERLKFLAIFSCNLDEFFMVRVAGLKRRANNSGTTPDEVTGVSALTAISQKVHELAEEQHLCFLDTILPQLTAEGIHLLRPEEISREQEQFLEDYFRKTLYPIVTPLAIDPGHPFPYLANRSLCLVVSLQAKDISPLPHTELSIVHIPAQVVRRFIQLPSKEGQYAFVLLEDVLRQYLPRLTMVLTFSPRMPFALRETLNSSWYGDGMRICWRPSNRESESAVWAMPFVCNTILTSPKSY